MVEFVSADWVESQLGAPDFLLVDPRGPMRYMQGHLGARLTCRRSGCSAATVSC